MLNNLTILLWLSAFVVIVISLHKTKHWLDCESSLMPKVMRLSFSVMTGLSFWATSVYVMWLMGLELSVGTVQDGDMERHWWLPVVTLFWTYLTYLSARK